MSQLLCLTSSYYYRQYASTGDVADTIAAVRTELLTRNVPAWTEPTANLFRSPADAAGRFYDVLLTRIDAGTLEFRVRDQLGRLICTRRSQPGTAPFLVDIFSGQFHLVIQHIRASGNDCLHSGLLDQSPDAQGSHAFYVFGGGQLSNTNVNDGYVTVPQCYMWDPFNGAGGYGMRLTIHSNSGSSACMYGMNGTRLYHPVEQSVQAAVSTWKVAGRRYQCLLCTSELQQLTEIRVPIDNISGLFRVVSIASNYNYRIAYRIA